MSSKSEFVLLKLCFSCISILLFFFYEHLGRSDNNFNANCGLAFKEMPKNIKTIPPQNGKKQQKKNLSEKCILCAFIPIVWEIWCPVWETGRFSVLYGRPGDLVFRMGDREIWCPVWETGRFGVPYGRSGDLICMRETLV